MKRCVKFLVIGLLFLSLTGTIGTNIANSLTFSQDIGVSFTFNPTITLTLSSPALIIDELSPGTAADSNEITINVLTNSTNGYTLNASVGNDTTYNTRDLVHKNNTVTNKFTSLATNASIATNTSLADDTWGYNYSLDNGTTWNSYSGLPLYSDTTNVALLKNSTGPVSSASGDNVKFKIAAKASTAQVSGEYNNVINFQLTATPLPKTLYMAYEDAGKEKLNGYFKLQDMSADICNAAEVLDEGSQMQAIDARDNKVYWIAKLRDGKCWFTQNLDHDINKDFAYTPENTDIPANWVPDKSTYRTGDTTWDNGIGGSQQSYDPGDKNWNGMFLFPDGIYDDEYACETYNGFWTTDGADYPEPEIYYCEFADLSSSTGNTHYHFGNYYSWRAAMAINDASIYSADQSICPTGWTLPKEDVTNNGAQTQPGSFQYLIEQYGWTDSNRHTNPQIWQSPLYFPPGGAWYDGHFNIYQYAIYIGVNGYWWSDSQSFRGLRYHMGWSDDYKILPKGDLSRSYGISIRCVSR